MFQLIEWTGGDLNPWHPPCEGGVHTTELPAHIWRLPTRIHINVFRKTESVDLLVSLR